MHFKMLFGHARLGQVIIVHKEISPNAVHNNKPILAIRVIKFQPASVSLVVDELLRLGIGISLLGLGVCVAFLGLGVGVRLLRLPLLLLLLIIRIVVRIVHHLLLHVIKVSVVGLRVIAWVVGVHVWCLVVGLHLRLCYYGGGTAYYYVYCCCW
jgi:hypothetical protein